MLSRELTRVGPRWRAPRNSVSNDQLACLFRFTVKDLPRAEVYNVEVLHRGKVAYSLWIFPPKIGGRTKHRGLRGRVL